MPTDAALLPPDPSVPGRYWVRYHDSKPGDEMMATWTPGRTEWEGALGKMTPWQGYAYGYRLATPHPIPGPAALEAIYAALAQMDHYADPQGTRRAETNAEYGLALGYESAAAMLRAALETKETT